MPFEYQLCLLGMEKARPSGTGVAHPLASGIELYISMRAGLTKSCIAFEYNAFQLVDHVFIGIDRSYHLQQVAADCNPVERSHLRCYHLGDRLTQSAGCMTHIPAVGHNSAEKQQMSTTDNPTPLQISCFSRKKTVSENWRSFRLC